MIPGFQYGHRFLLRILLYWHTFAVGLQAVSYTHLEAENRGSLQDMEKMQSVDLNYWLPGDILQKADKMSMARSLEVRGPFLDKELFDFVAKLPKETKIACLLYTSTT